jgi:hypothetical protein
MQPGTFHQKLGKRQVNIITDSGGEDAWIALPENVRKQRSEDAYQDLIIEIGEEEWSNLSDEQQEDMMEFFWVGCAMHKDLNGVKGGNTAMMKWWKETGLTGPVLLANKDNAAILDALPDDNEEELTLAEQRALEVTSSGAVKATSLAGFLFNHPDDKKGQQKFHQHWFLHKTGKSKPFPDTGNTRYNSHCKAAAELIRHLDLYREFMEVIRIKKEKQRLNHLEQNLQNALLDKPTLVEFITLARYHLAFTVPYLNAVRRPESEELNMLELGPLHSEFKKHFKVLIADIDKLIGCHATAKTGAFKGEEWSDPELIKAIEELKKTLPEDQVKGAMIAFLTGALEVLERLTSEFDEGGLIDKATSEQRKKIFLPTTNDAAEGALGGLRLYARKNSNWALHKYNALRMYKKNQSAEFMQKHSTPELMMYIRAEARR